MSLGLQPMGSPEFLVRGFGVFAQLCRSWSSQLPNVYVSALAVGLKVFSLMDSCVKEVALFAFLINSAFGSVQLRLS